MTASSSKPETVGRSMPRRVAVRGARGRMGTSARAAIEATTDLACVAELGRDSDIAGALSEAQAEICLDLTQPEALDALETALPHALETCRFYVIGTSGVDAARLERLRAAMDRHEEAAMLVVPNFCVGLVLLQRFAVEAGAIFRDVEISETHHEHKVDSPSGTALDTAQRIAAARPASHRNHNADRGPARGLWHEEIPVHSLRLPGTLARQVVEFGGPGELLTIRHDTLSREAFMPGLLLALRALPSMRGVHVGLQHALEIGA